jgi:hypothetical protein
MQSTPIHISDISPVTSVAYLQRVGFSYFLNLTGNLTGIFLLFDTWKRPNCG